MFLVSQVFGLIGFCLVVVAMTLKSRARLLAAKTASTVFILIGYGFLGSVAAMTVAAVSLLRGMLAFFLALYPSRKRVRRVAILFLVVVSLVLNAVLWQGVSSVLAAAASLISIACFFQSRVFVMRLLSIATSMVEIAINLIVFSPMNVAIELFTIGACVFGIVFHDLIFFWTRQKSSKKRHAHNRLPSVCKLSSDCVDTKRLNI